jgi:hypothetical protein
MTDTVKRAVPYPAAGQTPDGATSKWSADEMMTVAAARQLHDGAACFVGIGLPSTAANLARARRTLERLERPEADGRDHLTAARRRVACP